MHRPIPRLATVAFALLTLLTPLAVRADEGMWTFDHPPLEAMQKAYGFTPSIEWRMHVMHSCVNFGGGSGAFVSADGLVLTNHHVALNQLQKMSSAEHDYQHDGFFARTHAEEMPCPDLELKVLQSMSDITADVQAAIDPKAPPVQQNVQRKAAIAKLQAAASKRTGLKMEPVTLYQGGEEWLYGYRTYKDVRLVCAPEEREAFFGGDLDNFSFPRHDLDFAFFRVYENGAPLHSTDFLAWSLSGPKANDLAIVVGHPGRTNRQRTVTQLEYERDVQRPLAIRLQEQRVDALHTFAKSGTEQARQASGLLRGLENNLKRERGFLELLRDPSYLAAYAARERTLRATVAADTKLAAYSDAWTHIDGVQALNRTLGRSRQLHEFGRVSRLADIATGIVRMTSEMAKPNEQRFREYQDSNLNTQRFQLLSPAPIHTDLEEMLLAQRFQTWADSLGTDDAFAKTSLNGADAKSAAHSLFVGTTLMDVNARKALLDGGPAAIAASKDPMIVWARAIDAPYRAERKRFEDEIESVETLEGARIARARFALSGHDLYPDATGTLRLSYGRNAGYAQLNSMVPWHTTFYGLFNRANGFDFQSPYDLPKRMRDAEKSIDLSTSLDFVNTCDIIGGNSGSPVIDRDGRYVGLVFDGNIQSFLWTFGYSDAQARCVNVDSRAILMVLRKVYDMQALADELTAAAK
jgi:hypothetical protein